MKRCLWCNKEFESKLSIKKFCCKNHRCYYHSKIWVSKNKKHILEYARELAKKKKYKYAKKYITKKLKEDNYFKTSFYLKKSLKRALDYYTVNGKIQKTSQYGIDIKKIVKYLIRTLPSDYKERKYHIDHIRPLCSFDLNDSKQIIEAYSIENLRWLPAEENLKKGGRMEGLINF